MYSGVFCFLLKKNLLLINIQIFWLLKYRSFYFKNGKPVHAQRLASLIFFFKQWLYCLWRHDSQRCALPACTIWLLPMFSGYSGSGRNCSFLQHLWFRLCGFYEKFSPLQQCSLAELKWWGNPTPNQSSIYKTVKVNDYVSTVGSASSDVVFLHPSTQMW